MEDKLRNKRFLVYKGGDMYWNVTLTGKCYLAGKSQRMVEFICECGKVWWSSLTALRSGHTKSCGCKQKRKVSEMFTTHGLSKTNLYSVWEKMKDRCYNKNNEQFSDYGGRGISVCPQWVSTPEIFIKWAIDNRWRRGLTIERIDNDKGYSPSNCVFDTMAIQSRNKRSNVNISAFGETKCVADWVKDERCKVSFNTIIYRINKLMFAPEKAIITESLRRKKLSEIVSI